MKLHEIVREGAEKLHDLKCVNGAVYFGSVETPCSGRDTGECCHNEQTNEEACTELDNYFKLSQLSLPEAVKEMVDIEQAEHNEARHGSTPDDAYDRISTTLSEEIIKIKHVQF